MITALVVNLNTEIKFNGKLCGHLNDYGPDDRGLP